MSVRWTGSDGVERQAGFFAYRIEDLQLGQRVTRVGLGADLRLSGAERGLALGVKSVTETTPYAVAATDPRALPDQVVAYLEGDRTFVTPAPKGSRWGLFYLATPPTCDPVAVESTNLGLEWSAVGGRSYLGAGFTRTDHLVGRAVEDDVVLLRSNTTEPGDEEEWILWTLPLAETAPDSP